MEGDGGCRNDFECKLAIGCLAFSDLIIIQIPHHVQHVMSSESTLILSGAIPALELFMTKWEKIIEKNTSLKEYVKPGLECAYKYYDRMDRTWAYIIAMGKY